MINLALANNLICCPNDSKHSFKDIDNWIDHLSICTSENMAVKYYVCRFDHHHWFLTQKGRVLHETFQCNRRTKTKIYQEVIINKNNELIVPLSQSSQNELRLYFKEDQQRFPNFMNFISQFKQDQVQKMNQRKRVKLGDISNL